MHAPRINFVTNLGNMPQLAQEVAGYSVIVWVGQVELQLLIYRLDQGQSVDQKAAIWQALDFGEPASNWSLTSPTISSSRSLPDSHQAGSPPKLIHYDGDMLAVMAELVQQLVYGQSLGDVERFTRHFPPCCLLESG